MLLCVYWLDFLFNGLCVNLAAFAVFFNSVFGDIGDRLNSSKFARIASRWTTFVAFPSNNKRCLLSVIAQAPPGASILFKKSKYVNPVCKDESPVQKPILMPLKFLTDRVHR